MDVTFLISTYNRRDVLLDTLARLPACGLPAGRFEIIVVDNASTDGTADAVAARFPHVRLIREATNRGPCSKNAGLAIARGAYVVFLDDDSFPTGPRDILRMIAHFDARPRLAAAVFTVTLPNGTRECSAYPTVFIGCGTGFRKAALDQVGGLPEDFFMAGEEYDLSLRLLDAGWDVRPFADLHVTHLKTPGARFPERITTLDVRNNLLLVYRYFPQRWADTYRDDWMTRYRLIARAKGHERAFDQGLADAASAIAASPVRRIVSDATFERFANLAETERRLRACVERHGARRVLFVDLGKNIPAYRLAAHAAGVEVVAIADANLGGRGFAYHGIDVVTDEAARTVTFDLAVVSNLSPVHAAARYDLWRTLTDKPVVR
ncbi:MAG TPA: glycosyltransferase, partial [Tepidisphaeraceae bacterium]|nr:glycosyltransferase [Tepidisphaeraceae bacterium]